MAKKGSAITPKQHKFIELVVDGMTLSDAYRGAYNAENMSAASINREASVLFANPMIAARVQALRDRKDKAIVESGVSDAERVRQYLRRWMDDAEPADASKIRAAELLGRTVGLFKDVQVTDDRTRTPEEIRAELIRRLDQLADKSATKH